MGGCCGVAGILSTFGCTSCTIPLASLYVNTSHKTTLYVVCLYRCNSESTKHSSGVVFVCQVLYGVNQRLRVEDVDSPLCEVRPVKSVLLVVLTGDRGLCGGYNNFIIKRVSEMQHLRDTSRLAGLGVVRWDSTPAGKPAGGS